MFFRRLKGTQISSLLHFCFVFKRFVFLFFWYFLQNSSLVFSFIFFHLSVDSIYSSITTLIWWSLQSHTVTMFWYQFQLFLILKNWFHFSVFFFLSFSWYCCTKSGGEKERKNILLGPSILKKLYRDGGEWGGKSNE